MDRKDLVLIDAKETPIERPKKDKNVTTLKKETPYFKDTVGNL